jgi:hypothetical protein
MCTYPGWRVWLSETGQAIRKSDDQTDVILNAISLSSRSVALFWKMHRFEYMIRFDSRWTSYCANEVEATDRKRIVHAENAQFHTIRMWLNFVDQRVMNKVPHPRYSSDLAPSELFLFGHIKRILRGRSFELTALNIRSSWCPSNKLSYSTFLLSGCEGWSNVAILMRTTSNGRNNHAFDFPLLWLNPEIE